MSTSSPELYFIGSNFLFTPSRIIPSECDAACFLKGTQKHTNELWYLCKWFISRICQ
jgi:hypothetical protein